MKVHLSAVMLEDEVLKGEFRKLKKPYNQEKAALDPRRPKIKAQKQILDFWDRKWNLMVSEIKKEIETVIG